MARKAGDAPEPDNPQPAFGKLSIPQFPEIQTFGSKVSMRVRRLHRWNLTPRQAAKVQQQLAGLVQQEPSLRDFSLIAAVDVSYEQATRTSYAGVVVCQLKNFQIVERAGVVEPERFPYVPGLLSFREIPALLKAFRKIESEPDVVLCDGQGLAHPRRFGLACHLGLLLDRPCVGCAKSRLIGTYREPGQNRGCHTRLVDGGECIGAVLRTRAGVKPVFVSVGQHIDLASAVQVVLRCTRRYRLSEPIRAAHHYVNELRKQPRR